MEKYAFFILLIIPICLLALGKLHIISIKNIIKFLANTTLGFGLLYLINLIGFNYGFHIGINWVTLICTGLLGVPGCVLILLIKLLF